jgi:hypothetical protein
MKVSSRGKKILKGILQITIRVLFGPQKRCNFSLDESRTEDIPQVSGLENEQLTGEFTEKEVRETVFQMKHNKAPGPDGFPVEFY